MCAQLNGCATCYWSSAPARYKPDLEVQTGNQYDLGRPFTVTLSCRIWFGLVKPQSRRKDSPLYQIVYLDFW
jgi:hypothetical protein